MENNIPEKTLDDLADRIAARLSGHCQCGLTDADAKQIGHFAGMLADAGDGDMSKGVELLRNVMKTFSKIETIGTYVTRSVILVIVISILGGLGYFMKLGIMDCIRLIKR